MTTDTSLTALAAAGDTLAELRRTAADVLRRAWSMDRSRAALEMARPALDREIWDLVRSLGWCDVLVSESSGGGSATVAELCVLAEETGAAGVPLPLGAAAAAGWYEDRIAEGVALPLTAPAAQAAESDLKTVSGYWPQVDFAAAATRLLVPVTGPDGTPAAVAVDPESDGVELTPLIPLDHTPAAAVKLSGVSVDHVVAGGPSAAAMWGTVEQIVTLTSVAEMTGVVRAAHEAACEYAKIRMAFGRPIGANQAIKHRLVDQRATIEVARALTSRAARAAQERRAEAGALTSLAAFWAISSLRAIPEGALQVFGGIGYTWEHQAHLHLRRAACLAAGLGARSVHRSQVMEWLVSGDSPSNE